MRKSKKKKKNHLNMHISREYKASVCDELLSRGLACPSGEMHDYMVVSFNLFLNYKNKSQTLTVNLDLTSDLFSSHYRPPFLLLVLVTVRLFKLRSGGAS